MKRASRLETIVVKAKSGPKLVRVQRAALPAKTATAPVAISLVPPDPTGPVAADLGRMLRGCFAFPRPLWSDAA